MGLYWFWTFPIHKPTWGSGFGPHDGAALVLWYILCGPSEPSGDLRVPLHRIDRQLLERCLQQEPRAWNDFVDRYMGLVYHVIHHVSHARSVVLSPTDVEDVASEIFLGLLENDFATLRKFEGRSSLSYYLTVVARRQAIRSLVRRHRETRLSQTALQRSGRDDRGDNEPIAAADEVEVMLRNLGPREAEVVRLYHLQYQTYRQIGKRLGIPENSVGPILARARAQLRRKAQTR